MKFTIFENVNVGERFIYGNMTMKKNSGVATNRNDFRNPVAYNAIDIKTGDYWEMDSEDKVLIVVEPT